MALTPPILKAVGLPKFVPLIVIKVPTGPDAGLNELIAGAWAFVFSTVPSKVEEDINTIIKALISLFDFGNIFSMYSSFLKKL